jgi:hypothetical protein
VPGAVPEYPHGDHSTRRQVPIASGGSSQEFLRVRELSYQWARPATAENASRAVGLSSNAVVLRRSRRPIGQEERLETRWPLGIAAVIERQYSTEMGRQPGTANRNTPKSLETRINSGVCAVPRRALLPLPTSFRRRCGDRQTSSFGPGSLGPPPRILTRSRSRAIKRVGQFLPSRSEPIGRQPAKAIFELVAKPQLPRATRVTIVPAFCQERSAQIGGEPLGLTLDRHNHDMRRVSTTILPYRSPGRSRRVQPLS